MKRSHSIALAATAVFLLLVPGVLGVEGVARADAGDAGPSETGSSDATPFPTDGALPPAMPTLGTVFAKQCSESETRCQSGPFTVSKTEKIAADFDFDTGWQPSNAPVQIRLISYLHGRTRVDMSGALDATWPDAIKMTPKGRRATGLLAIDDGFVVKARIRFNVRVSGKDYGWEGDMPGVPNIDLASVSAVVFDPWAWKGAGAAPFTTGRTKQMELYKVPITDALIPIPGIEGGFQLEGEGQFSAEYVTLRMGFDELIAKGTVPDVDPMKSFTSVLLSSAPSFESTVSIHGELTRQTTLHFIPGLYFEILGNKFDLDLVDLPVPLPETKKPWDFDAVKVHFPLPRIEVKPNPVDLGDIAIGEESSVLLTTFDTGEARLYIDASDPQNILDVLTKHVEIEGGNSDAIRATLTPKQAGPIVTKLVLESNDPLNPKYEVTIKANAVAGAAPASDLGTEAAGGCGCNTPARASFGSWAALAALGLVVARRRCRTS